MFGCRILINNSKCYIIRRTILLDISQDNFLVYSMIIINENIINVNILQVTVS